MLSLACLRLHFFCMTTYANIPARTIAKHTANTIVLILYELDLADLDFLYVMNMPFWNDK
jgi:hypothetical protein